MRSAGAGDCHLPTGGVIQGEGHGDEARIETRGIEARIQHLQHFRGGTGMLDNVFAKNSDGERAEKRGRSAFAGDVAQDKRKAAVSVRKKIIEVAAEFASGHVRRSDVEAGNFARAAGQKLALNFASGVQLGEEALFVLSSFLVEARIFQRDGDERAEGSDKPLMLLSKRARLG